MVCGAWVCTGAAGGNGLVIAVIAALPREIAALARGKKPDAEWLKRGISLYRGKDAVVVAAGMGAVRAALAFEAALAQGAVTDVMSVGLAGGCAPGVEAGSVLEAHTVVDVGTGERFFSSVERVQGGAAVVLASADAIATVREKARLHASYGAAMVDMEAATLARLAGAHGLRFRAIKGVSDAYDFELAGLARFAGKEGSFRTGAFALHTALRPRSWRDAVKLGRGSSAALKALEREVRQTLAVHGVEF